MQDTKVVKVKAQSRKNLRVNSVPCSIEVSSFKFGFYGRGAGYSTSKLRQPHAASQTSILAFAEGGECSFDLIESRLVP